MMSIQDDERGATAVLIAICVVGLLTFTGLVFDGGNAYAQRRQMQNAADASALAGVNALYKYKTSPPQPANSIYDAALAKAMENGAKESTFTCKLVRLDSTGAVLGTPDCPEDPGGAVETDAYKVRVTLDSDHSTQFMGLVGIDAFTARGGAAATLLASGGVAAAPFMICGSPSVLAHPIKLLVVDITDPTGFAINTAAIGQVYALWGNQIGGGGQDCGASGTAFRGLVDNSAEQQLPGWWGVKTGNSAGNQIPLPLVGGCQVADNTQIKDIPVGCEFALPICISAQGNGTNVELYCVKAGRFRVTNNPQTGTPEIDVTFLGGGLVNTGDAAGIPTGNDVMVMKLSE